MFFSAVFAGMLIGIGGIIYLTIGGVLGAALFSVGLLSILHLRLDLFTGRAGRLATNSISVSSLLLILLGNICGTFLMGVIAKYAICLPISADAIIASRNNLAIPEAIFLGVGCGVLMFIATSNASPVLTILCVTTFISCGFTHCIADSFYYALAFELPSPLPFACTIVGNVIGCNIPPLVLKAAR